MGNRRIPVEAAVEAGEKWSGGRPDFGRTEEKVRRSGPERRTFRKIPGSDLLSHTPADAVPSAVAGLTSVFGMGTGVTLIL